MLNQTLLSYFILHNLPPVIAVAVSGGSDSMALLLLTHEWASAHGGKVVALTIDHRLRPESSQEAKQVTTWLAPLHIEHHILPWEGKKPSANIQETARNARYSLLTDWCRTHGIKHLLTAHHQDDQAETVAMRLARGSGVDGLSGILPLTYQAGIQILRPLLDIPKAELQAYLKERGQPWIEDPSNHNIDYARNALRATLNTYAEASLISKRLADTAKHMARVRGYLEIQTDKADKECIAARQQGYLEVHREAFLALHEEIALRLLAHWLMELGNSEEKPRFSSLERVYTAMQEGKPMTLHSCIIRLNKTGTAFVFYPETGGD